MLDMLLDYGSGFCAVEFQKFKITILSIEQHFPFSITDYCVEGWKPNDGLTNCTLGRQKTTLRRNKAGRLGPRHQPV